MKRMVHGGRRELCWRRSRRTAAVFFGAWVDRERKREKIRKSTNKKFVFVDDSSVSEQYIGKLTSKSFRKVGCILRKWTYLQPAFKRRSSNPRLCSEQDC